MLCLIDEDSLEMYDLMLQRLHKSEVLDLILKYEKYRAILNEILH